MAFLLFALGARAQDDVYPAKDYKGKLYITGGTIHIGNGQVIEARQCLVALSPWSAPDWRDVNEGGEPEPAG